MNKTTNTLPRPQEREVLLDGITLDTATFQPRGGGLNESHVAALTDVLRQGFILDPMALWEDPETGALTVADGHHRFEAYRRFGKANSVLTNVYRCKRSVALLIPIQDNAKARLALSYDDKANWAWRLTMEGVLSKTTVAASCGISERTVANMRQVAKRLPDEQRPNTWWAAQVQLKGDDQKTWTDEDREEWQRRLVEKADRQFGASFSYLIQQSPEAAADLVERCAGKQLDTMVKYLGYHKEIDEDEDLF